MTWSTMTAATREERLKIFEANWGRDFGWFVELGGCRLAALTDPRFEDMFWDSYAVARLAESEQEREAIYTKAFWDQPGLVFRNRVTGEVTSHAFRGGQTPTRHCSRITMRGLYSSLQPTILERVLLWFRRRSRR
jgi:hypothetical protein